LDQSSQQYDEVPANAKGTSPGRTGDRVTDEAYDFDKASEVLQAMDSLRGKALKTGIKEIVAMVDASFQILLTTYHSILRYEMTRLTGTEKVQ